MNNKQKTFSLVLLFGVLFFALPLHADELTEEQIKEISALWDDAQRLVGEEDYQAALKITEQVLDKLDQWRADEFSLYAWQELEVKMLMRDQQYRTAVNKQKELLLLIKDLYGEYAPKTVEARALLSDLEKIASLTPEQQKELSEGEAAYHAAVAEANLENAIALGEQMAAKEKQYLGEDCTWYTNSLSLLAGNYIAAKKYKQAEAKYLEGIKIIEKLYGQMHLNTAIWCDSLATLYSDLGDEEKAQPFLVRMYAIRHPIYGDQLKALDEQVIKLMRSEDQLDQLGEDELDQLIDVNSQYTELFQFIFGKAEPSVQSKLNLQIELLYQKANLCKQSGDIQGAEKFFRAALELCQRVRGKEHKDTALLLLELGSLFLGLKKYDDAEPLLVEALKINEKAPGASKMDTGSILLMLGSLYSDKREYMKAVPYRKKFLEISRELDGDDESSTVLVLGLLGMDYFQLGMHSEAEPIFKKLLKLETKIHGKEHPKTAKIINFLGLCYDELGDFAKAERYYKRAFEIQKKVLGEEHPDTMTSLGNLGLLYAHKGEYAKAEKCQKRVCELRKKVLGEEHRSVAISLGNLGSLYNDMGEYDKAEQYHKRAFDLRKKILNEDHPDIAISLNNLGSLYADMGEYDKAEQYHKRAFDLRKKLLNEDHPDIAHSLNNLASLYVDQGKYVEAEPLYKRSLSIREKAFGPDHPGVAISLGNLANLYSDQGKYAEAEPLLERAVAISEKTLGPEHPDVALNLNNLATLYLDQGKYAEAEPLYERANTIREKAFGPDHPKVGLGLNNLARLYHSQGKYVAAEPLYERAFAIDEKALGPEHPHVATSLGNLASLYSDQGKYGEGESLYERALIITEKALGPNHPKVSIRLNNLANLYSNQGKHADAEPLYARALTIIEENFGPDNIRRGPVLGNLAVCYGAQGKYAEAKPLYEKALAISEKALGPDHPDLAVSLMNLAASYIEQDAEVEQLYNRAIAICEKTLGPNHPKLSLALNNLAFLYIKQGKYTLAESLLKRSLDIIERAFGFNHPALSLRLNNIALLHSNQGNYEQVLSFVDRGLKIDLNQLESNSSVQSEQQQLAAAERLTSAIDLYIDACLRLSEKYDDAYLILLASKGTVTRRQQLMRSFADLPELEPLFAQLQSTASQLSIAYSSNKQIDFQLRQDRIDKLIKQKEAIEQQLSRQSQSFRQAVREVTTQELQAVLPRASALVDFCLYSTHAKSTDDQSEARSRRDRLAAFIIRPEGPIELVDLCSRENLQLALFFWKENLGRNTGPATELGKLIWEPLAQYVDDAELVLYSPIAELGSVPFAALPGKEPGSYLLEEKQLVMIPQAKLLPLIFEREQSPKPTVLAIGGVDYESVADNETEEPVQLAASRRAVRWNDEAVFTPLPETEIELDAVGKLYNEQFDLGKLQTLKDDRATEAAVKRLAPQYSHLHFATHGFFAPPEVKSALDNSDNQFQRQLSFDDQPRFTGFHPGLLSGLALAGANDPPEEGEDGIWTAEEVATMNLSKVDLAVLSACETGLGKVAGGEGLLGLQRAFQVSGAGTTVASLWQVDDAATRALMDEFYRNLWEKKLPKIEALRQAQLKMLREYDPQKGTLRGVGGVRQLDGDAKPERLPPFYWAAWVLSGDWR